MKVPPIGDKLKWLLKVRWEELYIFVSCDIPLKIHPPHKWLAVILQYFSCHAHGYVITADRVCLHC